MQKWLVYFVGQKCQQNKHNLFNIVLFKQNLRKNIYRRLMYFISVTTLTDLIASGIEPCNKLLCYLITIFFSNEFVSVTQPAPSLPSERKTRRIQQKKKTQTKKKTVQREKQISTSIYNGQKFLENLMWCCKNLYKIKENTFNLLTLELVPYI